VFQWGAQSGGKGGGQPYSSSPFTSDGRGNGNAGWSWGGNSGQRANPVVSGASESDTEAAGEDNDDDRRRYSEAAVKEAALKKRQYQATGYQPLTPAEEVAVTAKVVARWKSPIGGGTPGRRDTDQSNDAEVNRKHVLSVKPWTGSRKRAPPAPPIDDSYQAEIRAAKESKSCCANAIWFD
jgi:hypothetical protein